MSENQKLREALERIGGWTREDWEIDARGYIPQHQARKMLLIAAAFRAAQDSAHFWALETGYLKQITALQDELCAFRAAPQGEPERQERQRLVRIANDRGAGVALAAVGFHRCQTVHDESGQRCLKGDGHAAGEHGYQIHQGESVTWPAAPQEPPERSEPPVNGTACIPHAGNGEGFQPDCRRCVNVTSMVSQPVTRLPDPPSEDEEYLRAKEQGYCPHCGAGNGDWATDPFTGKPRWPK